jgi:hypothetical protein
MRWCTNPAASGSSSISIRAFEQFHYERFSAASAALMQFNQSFIAATLSTNPCFGKAACPMACGLI